MTCTSTSTPAQHHATHPKPGSARAGITARVVSGIDTDAGWAMLATGAFLAALPPWLAGGPAWAWGPLFALCYAAGGWRPGRDGLRALSERHLDVDVLMVVAALAAASIGHVLDGALLIVIFATSGALESFLTRRTADSVRSLLDLAPETATRVVATGPGERVEDGVPVTDLTVGEVILVRPGERVGADGTVIDGVSELDQASITGEPLPARRSPGGTVFAGTVNGSGALRVRVDRPAGQTVIARIVTLVEQASETKAATALFIERIEQRYSTAVVIATLALLTVPLAFGADGSDTLLRAITFMIVASPCALVLAAMPPLLAAIANAGRHGVLVKSAVALDRLATVDRVVLDKTGTLTTGTPTLETVRALPGAPVPAEEALALAAAAETPSEHPLARAIAAARDRGLPHLPARDFTAVAGHGVRATVSGRTVTVGSPALLQGAGGEGSEGSEGSQDAVRAAIEAEERAGRTAIVVSVDGRPAAVLALADRARPDAARAVADLRRTTGAEPVLLTGDNPRAARALGAQVGITDVRASRLPHEKAETVTELAGAGHRVLAIGDGVNDAPALAGAHCGVAVGRAAADLTIDSADVVLVGTELTTIPAAVQLARRARRTVVANLTIAGGIIAALVTWDLAGHLPLPLAVAGHEGSTVLVCLNGLRLLRRRAWRPSAF